MRITPLDIQQQRFTPRRFGGIDKDEVDAFLNVVAAEFEAMSLKMNALQEDQRHFKRLLEDYRAREEALKETMVTAQRVTEEIRKTAEREADVIVGRAELEAERLVEHAQHRLTELLNEIAEVKRQRSRFMSELRGMIQTHQKLLDLAQQDDGQQKVEENVTVMRKRVPAPALQPSEVDMQLERPRRVD